jgi:serine/threonine-protein kinase
MTHLIGQQLGRFLVQEEIGRGGMAKVYRALDPSLQRAVAIKILAPQLALDREFIRRFQREAVTAANLHHPNIVTVYDVGEAGGLHYIAMEYIRGRTLHAIIKERGALGLGCAIGIIAPIAAALDYAHAQGAVHRDVKPQNMLIDVSGRVKLTDFGIAQAPGGAEGERLTRTGIFMGTPEYISPEQASAQRVDGRSDLYSLGIATYEAITGMVPFAGATPQLIVAHVQSAPPPPSSLDPRHPPELDRVLARALAKNADDRFGSGEAFVQALRIVARRYGITPAQAPEIAELVLPQAATAPERSTAAVNRDSTTARGEVVPPPTPVAPEPPRLRDLPPIAEVRRTAPGASARPGSPPLPPDVLDPALRNGGAARRTATDAPSRLPLYAALGALALVVAIAVAALGGSGWFASQSVPVTPSVSTPAPPPPTAAPTLSPIPTAAPPTTEPPTATEAPTAASAEPKPSPPPPGNVQPTAVPPPAPTVTPVPPTAAPTIAPTAEPTAEPTVAPTAEPTVATAEPYPVPATSAPTAESPTSAPTAESPTASAPLEGPTAAPTDAPQPTAEPTPTP